MKTVVLHHSLLGCTRKIAGRFKYPYKELFHYREEDGKIVIIGRHLYRVEDTWEVRRFVTIYKKQIIGVIVCDDKNFGKGFADGVAFYRDLGIPILGVWDRAVSDGTIKDMEEKIDEKI